MSTKVLLEPYLFFVNFNSLVINSISSALAVALDNFTFLIKTYGNGVPTKLCIFCKVAGISKSSPVYLHKDLRHPGKDLTKRPYYKYRLS